MIEQAKFTYSSIGQAFENQIKTNEGTFEKHTHTHTHTHTKAIEGRVEKQILDTE